MTSFQQILMKDSTIDKNRARLPMSRLSLSLSKLGDMSKICNGAEKQDKKSVERFFIKKSLTK